MRRAYAAGLVALLAACENISLPRVPQVEQATEAVQDGGERYRAHRACANSTTSADSLIGCMREGGWGFVARGPGYPEADCWAARDRAESGRILPQCFTRTSAEAPAP